MAIWFLNVDVASLLTDTPSCYRYQTIWKNFGGYQLLSVCLTVVCASNVSLSGAQSVQNSVEEISRHATDVRDVYTTIQQDGSSKCCRTLAREQPVDVHVMPHAAQRPTSVRRRRAPSQTVVTLHLPSQASLVAHATSVTFARGRLVANVTLQRSQGHGPSGVQCWLSTAATQPNNPTHAVVGYKIKPQPCRDPNHRSLVPA